VFKFFIHFPQFGPFFMMTFFKESDIMIELRAFILI
jgi:hypothetical protein